MDNFRFELEYLYRSGGGDTSPLGGVESRGTREFLVAETKPRRFRIAPPACQRVLRLPQRLEIHTRTQVSASGGRKPRLTIQGCLSGTPRSEFAKDLELRNIEAAAGTVSKAKDELSDDGFGYQFLVGVDYWLTDHLLLGFKARYAEFDSLGGQDVVNGEPVEKAMTRQLRPAADRVNLRK